jgi:hypothetical protein
MYQWNEGICQELNETNAWSEWFKKIDSHSQKCNTVSETVIKNSGDLDRV